MDINDITLNNIKAFFTGNFRMFYDKLVGLPLHLQEQVRYRAAKCEDCMTVGHKTKGPGHCKECGCSVPGKWFVSKSCNNGKRFPDLMEKDEWDNFRKNNRI